MPGKWLIFSAVKPIKFVRLSRVSAAGIEEIEWISDRRQAEAFDTAAQAHDVIAWLACFGSMLPTYYADVPAPASDAPQYVPTRQEVIASAQAEEAVRRAIRNKPRGWGVVERAAVALFVFLTLAGSAGAYWSRTGAELAEQYLGTNPTAHAALWCADFVNLIERQLGRPGTGSRAAASFLHYGRRVSKPAPGDIVVMGRRGGGHVGYVTSDGRMISGNSVGRRVAVTAIPRHRVIAFIRP